MRLPPRRDKAHGRRRRSRTCGPRVQWRGRRPADHRRRRTSPVNRSAPISASGSDINGCNAARRSCGASTSRPSEPATWATTAARPDCCGDVSNHGVRRSDHDQVDISGGIVDRHPSPAHVDHVPLDEVVDRLANERPARPAPITRTVTVAALTAPPAARRCERLRPSPLLRRRSRRARHRARGRPRAPARRRARTSADAGRGVPADHRRSRRRPTARRHRGCAAPADRSNPLGVTLTFATHLEKLVGSTGGVELDHHIEEGVLLHPADRIGLVGVGDSNDVRDRSHGSPQVLDPVTHVRPEPEQRAGWWSSGDDEPHPA